MLLKAIFSVSSLFFLLILKNYATSHIPKITVLYDDRPPYCHLTDNGEISGAVCRPVAAAFVKAGIAFEWKPSPAKRQLIILKNNESRVCAVGWFKNSEREKFARYSLPVYRDLPTELLTRKSNRDLRGPVALDNLFRSGMILLVKNGYSYGVTIDNAIKKYQPKFKVTTKNNVRMIKMIHKGVADYMFVAPEEAIFAIKHSKILPNQFKMVEVKDAPPGNRRYLLCSMAVSQDVIDRFNQAFLKLLGLPKPDMLASVPEY